MSLPKSRERCQLHESAPNMEGGARSLAQIARESRRLFVRNPVIVTPSIVIALFARVLQVTVLPAADATPGEKIVGTVAVDVIQLLAMVASIAFTTGMAAVAWESGHCTLTDGWRAFRRDGGQVLVALVGLLVIATGAAFLFPFTFGLSALAFGFFCLYVMPAAIVRDREGLAAIRESWQIAYDHVLPTLGIVLGLFVTFAAIGVLAAFLAIAPGVGPLPASLAGALLGAVAIAFGTLVIVGEYNAS
jgi:hypothetical protein